MLISNLPSKISLHKELICVIILFFSSLFLRVASTTRYNFTQDEIFALEFNQVHSFTQLLSSPDFDHPPLWYMVMDPVVSIGASPFQLRLIQIIFFSTALAGSFLLLSPFSLKYRIFPLAWLAVNPYIIHFTAGYLMHSAVLCFALVTFCWILRIIKKHEATQAALTKTEIISLSFMMALGLLTDYSFAWFSFFLALFFGLNWLVKREKFWLQLLTSILLSGLMDVWFLPTFVRNLFLTAQAHKWALGVEPKSFLYLVRDLLGFVTYSRTSSIFSYGTVLIFVLLIFVWIHNLAQKKAFFPMQITHQWIALISAAMVFALFCSFFPGSFFYAKVCLTLIVPLTFLISFTCLKNWRENYFSLVVLILTVSLTLSSLVLYFQPTELYIWDYQQQPYSSLLNGEFPSQSCVFLVPWWTYSEALFNLPQKSNITLINSNINESTFSCKKFFYIRQPAILDDGFKDTLSAIRTQYNVCDKADLKHTVGNEQLFECY